MRDAVHERRGDLREQGAEAHILGTAQAPGEGVASLSNRSVGVRGLQPVSQRLLASIDRAKAGAGAADGLRPHENRVYPSGSRGGPGPVRIVVGQIQS